MFRALGSIALTGLLAILIGCGSGVSSSGNNGGNGGSGGGGGSVQVQHVVVVVFENEDYSTVVGNSAMPYWNQLANQYSLATQFFADVHPSLGNYLIMTAGQDPTLGSPDPDNWSGTVSGDNIASVLTAGGKSWKVYAQSIPLNGYSGGDQYPYVKHHNPFVYFQSVLGSNSQLTNVVNFSQFAGDVSSGLPSFSFVVPDDEHNGHDCPGGGSACSLSDRLGAIDNFLKNDMAPLLGSSSAMANTVVIITFDESATDATMGGGHIPVIVAGGPVKTGFKSTNTYQLQSILRFSLQSLGQTNYPGLASGASDMNEFLK